MTSEQLEEIDVLRSIFDGDECAKFLDDSDSAGRTRVQYIFGKDGSRRSFLVEFRIFVDGYPDRNGPDFELDLFYNNNLPKRLKDQITCRLNEGVATFLGAPMIYNLVEMIKESLDDLSTGFEDDDQEVVDVKENCPELDQNHSQQSKVTKSNAADTNQHLSKAQKRKMWDRGEGLGEKPRGWNWVDIVKHLSQTGSSN